LDTKILNINMINNDISLIKTAAKIVIESGTVAFPTETVYGLGANALNPKAIEKIFTAKGRPSDNPLIVHIDDKNKIQKYVYTNPIAELLMEKFWPGPLTIIFKKKNIIPDIVTSGLDTVAFRIPSHPIALLFLKESNIPIAAPSANISGKPSPTMAKHVVDDLFGKIDAIIDCESSEFGLESTVVDTTSPIPLILRPGTIAYDDLSKYVPDIDFHDSLKSNKVESQPSSPGMKYKHYSPNADLYIFEGEKMMLQRQL